MLDLTDVLARVPDPNRKPRKRQTMRHTQHTQLGAQPRRSARRRLQRRRRTTTPTHRRSLGDMTLLDHLAASYAAAPRLTRDASSEPAARLAGTWRPTGRRPGPCAARGRRAATGGTHIAERRQDLEPVERCQPVLGSHGHYVGVHHRYPSVGQPRDALVICRMPTQLSFDAGHGEDRNLAAKHLVEHTQRQRVTCSNLATRSRDTWTRSADSSCVSPRRRRSRRS